MDTKSANGMQVISRAVQTESHPARTASFGDSSSTDGTDTNPHRRKQLEIVLGVTASHDLLIMHVPCNKLLDLSPDLSVLEVKVRKYFAYTITHASIVLKKTSEEHFSYPWLLFRL